MLLFCPKLTEAALGEELKRACYVCDILVAVGVGVPIGFRAGGPQFFRDNARHEWGRGVRTKQLFQILRLFEVVHASGVRPAAMQVVVYCDAVQKL